MEASFLPVVYTVTVGIGVAGIRTKTIFLKVAQAVAVGVGGGERGGAGFEAVLHFPPIGNAGVIGVECCVHDLQGVDADGNAVGIGDHEFGDAAGDIRVADEVAAKKISAGGDLDEVRLNAGAEGFETTIVGGLSIEADFSARVVEAGADEDIKIVFRERNVAQ